MFITVSVTTAIMRKYGVILRPAILLLKLYSIVQRTVTVVITLPLLTISSDKKLSISIKIWSSVLKNSLARTSLENVYLPHF